MIVCDNGPEFISQNLEDAREEIEKWRKDYNQNRPHSSLKYKTPNKFAKDYEMMLTS